MTLGVFGGLTWQQNQTATFIFGDIMKIAVLTSLIGLETSTLKDPSNLFANIDYYAFVDKNYNSKIWKEIDLPKFSTVDNIFANRRNAKLPKILGSILVPGYDYYIWHDHHLDINVNPKIMVDMFLMNSDMGLFKHQYRSCVYDEMDAILDHNFETVGNIISTRNFLRQNNYPSNAGLFELSSFIYRNTFETRQMFLSWWELICRFSSRDQITFPYVKSLYNISHSIIPGCALSYGGNNSFIPDVRSKYS